MVVSCDLRGLCMACRCGRLLTKANTPMIPSKLACFSHTEQPGSVQTCALLHMRLAPSRRIVACDLRWVQGSVAAVALGDGETHCSKVRSDRVRDGSSWRSQAATEPCGFYTR